MLSRSGSNTSDALRRSKSSSSVHGRRSNPLSSESIDPETARIHALIAAHRAMDRSQGYRVEGRNGPLNASNVSSSSTNQIPHIQYSPTTELHRQRSILHAKAPSLTGTSSFTGARIFDNIETDTNRIDNTSEFGESYGAEPSSYRRLHKARSMLTPKRQWQQIHASGTKTPFSQARTLRHAVSTISIDGSNLGLRLRRSFNRLRTPNIVAVSPKQPHQNAPPRAEAIRLARDQFLRNARENNQQQSISQTARTRASTIHRSFPKSLRTTQLPRKFDLQDDYPAAQISPPLRKIRSISVSLRDRFKRAFSKPKVNAEQLPPQQLNSIRPHYEVDAMEQHNMGFDRFHRDNVNASRRNSFYVPADDDKCTSDEVAGLLQAVESNGSCASVTSNARSRVTSWTNSTVAGSLHENAPDCKRLSVIKEDGSPHQPSSSAGRHLGGVPVSQQPFKSCGGDKSDTQRLYSALMRQIDQGNHDSCEVGPHYKRNNEETNLQADPINHERSIIRAVPSQQSIVTVAPDAEHREFSLNISSWPQTSGMTPEKLSDNVKRRKELLKMQEAQSSFFPHSSENKLEATSPFRRLLMARRDAAQGNGRFPDSEGEVEDGDVKTNFLLSNRRNLSSESVYSRTTHGGTNPYYEPPIASAEDLGTQEELTDTGFATILPTRSRKQMLEQQERVTTATSTTSTGKTDWRGWMDHRMSKLRPSSSRDHYHLRENAQINPDEKKHMLGDSLKSTAVQDSCPGDTSDTMRTPSPSARTVEQLSIPKRRSPLIGAKKLGSYVLPTMSRNISTNSNQMGQLARSKDDNRQGVDGFTGGESRALSTTLRKISSANVAQLLKGKRSLPSTQFHHTTRKENKLTPTETTPIDDVAEYPTLQMRSGNSIGELRGHGNFVDFEDRNASTGTIRKPTESPTDRVKASLSARLSRPFDMETPEYNRPFDSMYLGKRQMGFNDNLGGRLSVAPSATPIAAQARGPRGYGGLGTPVLSRPGRPLRDEETTALPHFPTPEDEEKKGGKKLGMSLRSNRMVSNFLRSRRRNSDRDNNEGVSQDETEVKWVEPPASSPMFL